MASAPQPVCLRQGPLELQCLPGLGACCAALRHHSGNGAPATDILRPLPAGDCDPFASGFFAMVPYANRLFGQVLQSDGQGPRQIALNRAGVPHPVHGVGWMQPWQVVRSSPAALQLAYERAPDAHWPFAHGAAMDIRLSAQALRIELALHNRSQEPMPAGMGFHPWLMAERDAELRFDAQHVWRQDATGLPLERIAPAQDAQLDCAHGRLVHGLDLNHCYASWCGTAELRRPSAGLRVQLRASADQGHLQVYRPPGQPWVCVEPQSHATGAFSLPACHLPVHGVRWLAPGATMRAWIEVTVAGSAVPAA